MQLSVRLVLSLCVFALAVRSVPFEAQSGNVVRGRILDAKGAPVVRVKVTIGPSWGFTDSEGRYVLSRIPEGRYKVTLEYHGQTVSQEEIEVEGPVTDVPDLKWPH
jgi:hypothetical protein